MFQEKSNTIIKQNLEGGGGKKSVLRIGFAKVENVPPKPVKTLLYSKRTSSLDNSLASKTEFTSNCFNWQSSNFSLVGPDNNNELGAFSANKNLALVL